MARKSRKRPHRHEAPPPPLTKQPRPSTEPETDASDLASLRCLVLAASALSPGRDTAAAERLRAALDNSEGAGRLDSALDGTRQFRLLHEAARAGPGPALGLLLRAGADPEVVDDAGRTPLMLAAGAGNVGGVAILLDAGAKTDPRDARGRAALHAAIAGGCEAAATALLQRGAIFDNLYHAGQRGWFEQLQQLWLQQLARPLLREIQRLQAACFRPPGRYRLCGALPPLLTSVGCLRDRRVLRFRSPNCSDAAAACVRLLLVAIAHFDGRGGVSVRTSASRPPMFVLPPMLNGRQLRGLLRRPADLLYALEPLAPSGAWNQLELFLLPDCPAGSRLLMGGFAFVGID